MALGSGFRARAQPVSISTSKSTRLKYMYVQYISHWLNWVWIISIYFPCSFSCNVGCKTSVRSIKLHPDPDMLITNYHAIVIASQNVESNCSVVRVRWNLYRLGTPALRNICSSTRQRNHKGRREHDPRDGVDDHGLALPALAGEVASAAAAALTAGAVGDVAHNDEF